MLSHKAFRHHQTQILFQGKAKDRHPGHKPLGFLSERLTAAGKSTVASHESKYAGAYSNSPLGSLQIVQSHIPLPP